MGTSPNHRFWFVGIKLRQAELPKNIPREGSGLAKCEETRKLAADVLFNLVGSADGRSLLRIYATDELLRAWMREETDRGTNSYSSTWFQI